MSLKLLLICQLAEPDEVDLSVFAGLSEGEDDLGWIQSRFEELGVSDAVDVHGVHVCLGEEIPPIDTFDAAIIGGSYHMVGDDRPWQRHLLQWMREARETGKPCLGICGGHQLMGVQFGAKVSGLPDEICCGTLQVDWTDAGEAHWLFRGIVPDTEFHFGNYEHVVEVPAGATALATRESSPAVAADFGGDWVGVQFHPEMSAEAMARSWQPDFPERAQRYRASPGASRVLLNFLFRAGLEPAEAKAR